MSNYQFLKEYQGFLSGKMVPTPKAGFSVSRSEIHPICFPYQADAIQWGAEGGRRAIFAHFGLGKTIIQLQLAMLCLAKNEGKALIVCPLAVKQEFYEAADMLSTSLTYCRTQAEVEAAQTRIIITNYERVRDGDIRPDYFVFASLDEASVLRSYGSKTYQEFLAKFQRVQFRYVCTATPSPNKYKELIHYAGFLGVMDTGQALTRFFKRDSTKANNLTIHPHKEREFWLWVSSWALFITKPSDLGYSDEGFALAKLHRHWHLVKLPNEESAVDRDGQLKLVRDEAIDLRSSAKEKRDSMDARILRATGIVDGEADDTSWVIWHDLEKEREKLEETAGLLGWTSFKSVYGSQDEALKEKLLIDFKHGNYRILATKPSIAGQGCNFQKHCYSAIFLGITYKFNDIIQAVHRIQRYGQTHDCHVHFIYTDAEEHVRREFEAKWQRHDELVATMTGIVKEFGLSQTAMLGELNRSMGVEREEVRGDLFSVVHNDCILETASMEENSVGLILTSIPFSNHYEYTPSYNDLGHTNNDDHFFAQMDFLTPNLLRVLKPGRIAAVHVKDRILFGSVTGTGMPTVNPFHMKTTFHFMKHGFEFIGMITIETDVVRENNGTYRLGWTEQCKDGSKMGVGSPEYLLLFRKLPSDTSKAYADEPVVKSKEVYTRGRWQIDARAKWNSSGNTLLTPEEIAAWQVDKIASVFMERSKTTVYEYAAHVESANEMDRRGKLPATFESLRVAARTGGVWDDVVRMHTLNSRQSQHREEQHICPFQIDIVDRAITRWSNEGDVVYDPFGGLGTVGNRAILLNRRSRSCELNPDYFRCNVAYHRESEYKRQVPTLFDLLPA
ncbi:DNA methylase N-4 [Spirosoma sp. KCTC 42546]|uniref:DNA methyltransferase n=1 Tax=Spirosoma sp. KCTC 42546 TaxID=2520506 RepID=UPI00115AA733|nr:DNA methyltransferase [Spirosoma sp. KCTC 42546]QDK80867.1 DNA methylase N-4 [Spirosoma sp. KCTC 42546]